MTSPSGWVPFATQRPISWYKDAGLFTTQPLGWVLHVQDGNGSPWGAFQGSLTNNPRFSHLWVSKSGAVEQYAPLEYKSWAQAGGNSTYWSVETEGLPDEPLNAAQIDTLGRIHNYLHTQDLLASTPGQPGIGTHYMGGAAWGGHSCPDPSPGGQGPRSHQRQAIIDAAVAAREEDMRPVLIRRGPKGQWAYLAGIWIVPIPGGVPPEDAPILSGQPSPITVDPKTFDLFIPVKNLTDAFAAVNGVAPASTAAGDAVVKAVTDSSKTVVAAVGKIPTSSSAPAHLEGTIDLKPVTP